MEADAIGICLMARAGHNPHAAISVLQKLESANGQDATKPVTFSTHPPPQHRIASIRSLLPQAMRMLEASNYGFAAFKRHVAAVRDVAGGA
jgi:predicted Zn-dependent protease